MLRILEGSSLNFDWRPAFLTEIFRGFSQSFQAGVRSIPQIGLQPLPSMSLPIYDRLE
jgi:hypothetical protein